MDGWLGSWKMYKHILSLYIFKLEGKYMTITNLQQWVADDWRKHSKHQPTVELQLLYIMEELGEVAEAIRKQDGKKDRKQSEVDLGSEMADLVISIMTLANHFEVNIEDEVRKFQDRILKRHSEGY